MLLTMLSGNAEICDLPKLKPGTMVNCVLSRITSDNLGDIITVVVVVAIGEEVAALLRYPEQIKIQMT